MRFSDEANALHPPHPFVNDYPLRAPAEDMPQLARYLAAQFFAALRSVCNNHSASRFVTWDDSHYVQARCFCLVYHKLLPLCKALGLQPSLSYASPGSHAAHINQTPLDTGIWPAIQSTTRSPIMTTVACAPPDLGMRGITDASTTHNPWTPLTLQY